MDIKEVTVEQVAQVYSGKPGCACGCRGAYRQDARNIKRILTMFQASDEVQFEDGIFSITPEDGRWYTMYLKNERG